MGMVCVNLTFDLIDFALVSLCPNCRDEKSRSELDGWNLEFNDKLVSYTARVLPAEKIIQKSAQVTFLGLLLCCSCCFWCFIQQYFILLL